MKQNYNEELINKHYLALKEKYQALKLVKNEKNEFLVEGNLWFSASYEEKRPIEDIFNISIFIPINYPKEIPSAKEIGSRIPKNFHYLDNGYFCLATYLEQCLKFEKQPNLLGFVNELLIPYLYSFCYFKKYEKMPYGELVHGQLGILQSYCYIFNTSYYLTALKFLHLLIMKGYKGYRGNHICLCGSGKKFMHCHKDSFLKLVNYQKKEVFCNDYKRLMNFMLENNIILPSSLTNEKTYKYVHEKLSKIGKNNV